MMSSEASVVAGALMTKVVNRKLLFCFEHPRNVSEKKIAKTKKGPRHPDVHPQTTDCCQRSLRWFSQPLRQTI